MRTRFIHDEFELDVSHLALSWTEENTWFKDSFFLTSSFPFDIDYEENQYFEFFQHYNLTTPTTYFQGRLEKDGKIEEAILEVEEAGEKLRITIRYGVEALPNWDKKLSELDLEVVLPGGGNMRVHAETIITQTYPAVNYNFPAVHTKFYDGAPMFEWFQNVLNKRVEGAFIANVADGFNTKNRNIVYPLPYDLYVLNACFLDAGYTLHGDILTDPDFIDAIIVPGKKLANYEDIPEPIEWIIAQTDRIDDQDEHWEDEWEDQYGIFQQWYSEQEINFRGSFRLVGDYINDETRYFRIKLNGNIIYEWDWSMPHNFLLFFETLDETNLLEIFVVSVGIDHEESTAVNMTLTTFYLLDEFGEMLPFVANFSNVNLATALPDITVGEFITQRKKTKNYDMDLRDNKEIWMNLTQNEVTNSSSEDISEYDVKNPNRKYEQAKSFLLQYEGEYDEKYPFDKVYADRTGFQVNDFIKATNTTEISISAIPLPIDTIISPNEVEESSGDSITTAVQLSDDASKVQWVKYNGLTGGENWTKEMTGLKTLNLYLNYWQRWLNFMIHAVIFKWTVRDKPNLLIRIKRKGKLFAYNNFLFVHTLNRKRQGDLEEVDIEAYSSKV